MSAQTVAALDEDAFTALAILAGVLGIALNLEDLQHRYRSRDEQSVITNLLRAAKSVGLKARMISARPERLPRIPMPALAIDREGRVAVVGGVTADHVLVQYPAEPGPRAVTRDAFHETWSGKLILVARRANGLDQERRFGLSWFLPAVHRYRRVLGEVLLASFFLQILALVSPLFFQVVIDKVMVNRGLSTLDILMIGLGVIALFEMILGTLRTYVFAHTTNRIDVELSAKLFSHLLSLPLGYFGARRVGDSVARIRELESIRSFITGSGLTLVIDLLFTVVFVAVMFLYSPLLSAVVLGSLPLYVAISFFVMPIFRRRLDEKFARGAENQALLVEAVTGVETVKAMAIEPQLQTWWEEQLAGYVKASFNTQTLANMAGQSVQIVNKLTGVLVLWLGAHQVLAGDLTVGEIVAFSMLSAQVTGPVLRIAQLWQDFQQVGVSIDRLGDILNTPREVPPGTAVSLPPIRGEIRFEHVGFRYRPQGAPVLSDVSLTIEPGQVIGIVGPSGSGKSTFAKLIQRLHVPHDGRVFIDGADLALIDTAWLRRQIGIVLQENILFNRSVRDNIALAKPSVSIGEVIEAATLAGAHDFILELPRGYDTVIGERGASLSGGQRQRIAIARALVTNPRILIFDEATSALDYESERIVQDNMRRITAGRTVLIIAHRLSTVRHADRILTLERGRLVEDGSHEDLIRSGGRYAQLHYLQAGISDVV
ncbi:MAG TPA: type I secretion system permease/ATPase [Stellaceae bacterium]|nr:type I secretion system permease/ATPase [Stellaceae bacterium]